jgi:hypothetical protein
MHPAGGAANRSFFPSQEDQNIFVENTEASVVKFFCFINQSVNYKWRLLK